MGKLAVVGNSSMLYVCTPTVGKEVLAAHSLMDNPSNDHPNKPAKPAMDPVLVQDIVGKS